MNLTQPLHELEQIRQDEGNARCLACFAETCRDNAEAAVKKLNQPNLPFSTFFLVLPELEKLDLHKLLKGKQATAQAVIHQLQQADKVFDTLLQAGEEAGREVLHWIVETGGAELSLEDGYRKIIDIAVSLLCNHYHDESIIPTLVELIFTRHKDGHQVHDLIWSLIRLASPVALKLVAEYLDAPNLAEAELACKILGLAVERHELRAKGPNLRKDYLHWLQENEPYLQFTGESLQYASNPQICTVDYNRKYHQGNPPGPNEPAFKALPEAQQNQLAAYSQQLKKQDAENWQSWFGKALVEQLIDLPSGKGGAA